jgi:hypothetical protein
VRKGPVPEVDGSSLSARGILVLQLPRSMVPRIFDEGQKSEVNRKCP